MRRTISILGIVSLMSYPVVGANSLETATFAAGCFWGTEEFFRKVPGVVETRVGYSGGSAQASYKEVSSGTTGHAESLEIKFDPQKVAYQELLLLFFKMHDPTTMNQQGNDRGTQYRSIIFTHSEKQRKIAEEIKAKIEKSGAWKKPLVTEIIKAKSFYPAELHHQKYLIKNPGGYDNHFLRDLKFD
ncbi:MAG: peptide-methionine (S)-S-oxide reductase MsrA [Bdellovibrionia bacterium]